MSTTTVATHLLPKKTTKRKRGSLEITGLSPKQWEAIAWIDANHEFLDISRVEQAAGVYKKALYSYLKNQRPLSAPVAQKIADWVIQFRFG